MDDLRSEFGVYLTVAELAKIVKLTPRTVYQQLRKGAIPGAKKFGGSWRINSKIFFDSFEKTE